MMNVTWEVKTNPDGCCHRKATCLKVRINIKCWLEKQYKIKMALKEHNWYSWVFFCMLLFSGFPKSSVLLDMQLLLPVASLYSLLSNLNLDFFIFPWNAGCASLVLQPVHTKWEMCVFWDVLVIEAQEEVPGLGLCYVSGTQGGTEVLEQCLEAQICPWWLIVLAGERRCSTVL